MARVCASGRHPHTWRSGHHLKNAVQSLGFRVVGLGFRKPGLDGSDTSKEHDILIRQIHLYSKGTQRFEVYGV